MMSLTRVFLLTSLLMVQSHSVDIECRQSVDHYFSRRYLSLSQEQVSYHQLIPTGRGAAARCQRQQLPLRQFTQRDVVRCFDVLSIKRKRRPIHVAFVGDSIVRQYFIGFIRLFPDLDRRVKTQSTFAAEYYFHEDRNITSPLLDNLLISFYWRSLIKQDLLVDLQRWASNTEAPDYIVLGVFVHHVISYNVTDTLEKYENLLANEVLPLIKQILAAHPNQEIIWLRQSSTTDYMGPSGDRLIHEIDSEKIFKYNQAVDRILNGTRVMMWDSINPITEEYLRGCGLNRISMRGDRHKYVNCRDFIHAGFGAISVGSQLFINHICSPLVHQDQISFEIE